MTCQPGTCKPVKPVNLCFTLAVSYKEMKSAIFMKQICQSLFDVQKPFILVIVMDANSKSMFTDNGPDPFRLGTSLNLTHLLRLLRHCM